MGETSRENQVLRLDQSFAGIPLGNTNDVVDILIYRPFFITDCHCHVKLKCCHMHGRVQTIRLSLSLYICRQDNIEYFKFLVCVSRWHLECYKCYQIGPVNVSYKMSCRQVTPGALMATPGPLRNKQRQGKDCTNLWRGHNTI